jgi:hypothetical protein
MLQVQTERVGRNGAGFMENNERKALGRFFFIGKIRYGWAW